MASEQRLTFPVVSFRNLDTPFSDQGYRDYYAVVQTTDLPELARWRKINVRDPKLSGAVPKAIRGSLHDNPEMFLFMNRGITMSVDSVTFDNKSSTVTVTLTDPELHGLLDGGHTYNIVNEEAPNLEKPQFIKLEFLEGFDPENITQVVDARNTSNQVRDESLMNLAGKFGPLKEALKHAPYYDRIAWSEYQTDEKGSPLPIDVREIIAILTAFDRENFSDKTHPINAYRSKAACLKHFKEHTSSYKKIYPIAQQVLALYDHIQDRLPEAYNVARGVGGGVSGGKFGRLTGVSVYKGKRAADLYFIGKKTKYGIPAGFIYPILGAFRALLEVKSGRYVWGKGLDPVALLDGDLGLHLADTLANYALEAQNPSKTGKSPMVWQACYQCVELHYLKA